MTLPDLDATEELALQGLLDDGLSALAEYENARGDKAQIAAANKLSDIFRGVLEALRPVGECDEMLGSWSGDTPPEACGVETPPGDHLCAKHRKRQDAMEQYEAEQSAIEQAKD